MLSVLRRRFSTPASAPSGPTRPEAEAVFADAAVVERADRIRTALQEAGLNLDDLGPAPAWLATARAGTPVLLDPDSRAELGAYMGASTSGVTSEAACDRVMEEVEALGVLREMRTEGINVICGPRTAAELRGIRDAVREHH
ncbi:hypothetical protein ACQPZG_20280 [Streptomyces sp. CA-294286]|uniref:hypothetical protein n=1 Tax=Streptomyces sp. CA-294286 TaxID=3240070 RepID=UPI003D94FC52